MQVFITVARQGDRVYLHLQSTASVEAKQGPGHVNIGLPVADAEKLVKLLTGATVSSSSTASMSVDDAGMGGEFEEYL